MSKTFKEIQSDFVTLVGLMIDMNHLLRSQNRINLADQDAVSRAVQFCTIRCNVFRGIGKTQYIIDNATENDLIVVKDESCKKMLLSRFDGKNVDILSASKVKMMQGRAGKSYRNIYVDEPGMCFDSRQLFEFYSRFVDSNTEQTFILLGM